MYSPGTARWMSKDPLGVQNNAPNAFMYAESRPTKFRDPSGLSVWDCFGSPHQKNGQACGYSIWLLTGSCCADPNVVIDAANRHEEFVECWWQCEVDTHTTACGMVFTGTEVVAGTLTVVGSRIYKTPQELIDPADKLKSLFADLARKFGKERAEEIIRQLARNRALMGAAKTTAIGAAIAELGISINCSWNCSE